MNTDTDLGMMAATAALLTYLPSDAEEIKTVETNGAIDRFQLLAESANRDAEDKLHDMLRAVLNAHYKGVRHYSEHTEVFKYPERNSKVTIKFSGEHQAFRINFYISDYAEGLMQIGEYMYRPYRGHVGSLMLLPADLQTIENLVWALAVMLKNSMEIEQAAYRKEAKEVITKHINFLADKKV